MNRKAPMRRSGRLQRKTPLRSRVWLNRRTPLKAVGAKSRRERDDWEAARAKVWERDQGVCRRCGRYASLLNVHHLVPADRDAGRHDPERLVLLCSGPGSNDCHGHIHRHPDDAYRTRWLYRGDGPDGDLQALCGSEGP